MKFICLLGMYRDSSVGTETRYGMDGTGFESMVNVDGITWGGGNVCVKKFRGHILVIKRGRLVSESQKKKSWWLKWTSWSLGRNLRKRQKGCIFKILWRCGILWNIYRTIILPVVLYGCGTWVADSAGGKEAEGVWENGAEENIWTQEGWGNGVLDEIA